MPKNDEAARQGRPDNYLDRSPHSSGRLGAFAFILIRGDESREATFYAISRPAALRLARAWASARGWVVEDSA